MGDAFKCVLNRMCIVVQRIDAPFVALSVMMCAHNAVDCRVAQVHVRGRHVDFSAQGVAAVRELAVLHPLKQVKVFLHRAVAVRAFLAGFGQGAAVLAHFVGAQVIDVSFAFADELEGKFIALIKVVRAVVDAAGRLCTQPAQVLLDGFYILVILADRVGVVKAQIKQTVVFLCGTGVDPDGFCRTDMQVAVWFWWKTGVDFFYTTLCQVAVDNIMDKIRYIFGIQDFFISHEKSVLSKIDSGKIYRLLNSSIACARRCWQTSSPRICITLHRSGELVRPVMARRMTWLTSPT